MNIVLHTLLFKGGRGKLLRGMILQERMIKMTSSCTLDTIIVCFKGGIASKAWMYELLYHSSRTDEQGNLKSSRSKEPKKPKFKALD